MCRLLLAGLIILQGTLPFPGPGGVVNSSGITYTHAQASASGGSSGTSTVTATLTNNPATGDLVCVMVWVGVSGTLATLKDSNSNSYTVLGPSNTQSTGPVYLAYLVAPSNATKTITATASPGGENIDIVVDDFTASGGTPALITDVLGNSASTTSPTTTPTITPGVSGHLLYAAGNTGNTSLNGVLSPWAQNSTGHTLHGANAEYILSAGAGAQTVGFTWASGNNVYNTIAMEF